MFTHYDNRRNKPEQLPGTNGSIRPGRFDPHPASANYVGIFRTEPSPVLQSAVNATLAFPTIFSVLTCYVPSRISPYILPVQPADRPRRSHKNLLAWFVRTVV